MAATAAKLWLLASLAFPSVTAMQLNVDDQDSLKHAAFVVSHGMMSYYSGNQSGQTPGYLPNEGQIGGYYWWEGSGVFGSLMDYWYYTGDDTYNDVVSQAMLWQAGPDRNYEPLNASQTLGNDDIGYWAASALKAAELNFPNPPPDQPQWIQLAQAVFNNFVDRWDTTTCNGGLHWQAFIASSGYQYKNSPPNGVFFNIAARLAKYTNDDKYKQWAEKVFDWARGVELLDENFLAEDGVDSTDNCTHPTQKYWTYNQGAFLHGAACMWNITQDDIWQTRTNKLLEAFNGKYVRNNVVAEIYCQDTVSCNNDEKLFKSFTVMWLSETAKIAKFTEPKITPVLDASAQGAAKSCSGGDDGVTCGVNWETGSWDNQKGIGEECTALEAFNAVLAKYKAGPINNFNDGGSSISDPEAGAPQSTEKTYAPVTGADRAGAGIITFMLVAGTLATAIWMFTEGNPFTNGFFKGSFLK